MRIDDIEALVVPNDLVGSSLVVRITTDTGITGIGQSGAWGFPNAVAAVIRQFREYLLGKDPFAIESIQRILYRSLPFRGNILWGALSAVDVALWDIKGRALEVPTWELMGGKYRDRVRLHLMLVLQDGTPDEVFDLSRRAAEEGYTGIKFDPLGSGYADSSAARLVTDATELAVAARDGAGPNVDIIFEIHRKLSPVSALTMMESLAQVRPLFFEDLVQIDSPMLQGDLVRRTSFPIANGERLNTVWEFRDLFEAGGPQFVRPDVGLAGGLTGCRKVAALAEAHHSGVVPHNFLGPLHTAASVHLAVSAPAFVTCDYLEADEQDSTFDSTIQREGGFIEAPQNAGLGVTLGDSFQPLDAVSQEPPLDVQLRFDGSPEKA